MIHKPLNINVHLRSSAVHFPFWVYFFSLFKASANRAPMTISPAGARGDCRLWITGGDGAPLASLLAAQGVDFMAVPNLALESLARRAGWSVF